MGFSKGLVFSMVFACHKWDHGKITEKETAHSQVMDLLIATLVQRVGHLP